MKHDDDSILRSLTAERLAYAIDPKARPKGAAAEPGRRAGGYVLRCPCHEDKHPSMSIDQGADGRILMHCHAGCAQETIIEELRSRGLWPKPRPERDRSVGSAGSAGSGARYTGLPKAQELERAQAVLFVAESDRLSERLARLSKEDHLSIRRAQETLSEPVAPIKAPSKSFGPER